MFRPRHPLRRVSRRIAGESGEVATTVVVSGFFFAIVVVVIQLGIWSHANHVALAAADNGNQAARAYGSGPGAGVSAANDFLARLGSGVLSNVSVSATLEAGDVAVVTVSGDAESIVPGLHHRVIQTSVGAVQEFRPSG